MTRERAEALLGFVTQGDGLKHVLRAARTRDPNGRERHENAAEHAWHVALIAVALHPEAWPCDLARVLSQIAVHDVVEIEAGDTFAFDERGVATQAAREAEAAGRVFAGFPALRALWEEFEAAATPEARFAMGCDRLQGFAQQVECGAPAWREIGLTRARSLVRMGPAIALGPPFAPLIERLYARALAEGLLLA